MRTIPWWAVAAAWLGPVLLVGGFLLAGALQPASYDPVRDTISDLAKRGALDAWVMVGALVGLGLCYLLIALGLTVARAAGRLVLGCGGIATVSIGLCRQPLRGYSVSHELAVVAAAATCCTWTVFAARPDHRVRLLRLAPSLEATAVCVGLATWYSLESHGALLGIAERCASVAPPLWMLVVVVAADRTSRRDAIGQARPSRARASRRGSGARP